MNYLEELNIIKEKYCIGCGICTVISQNKIVLNSFGNYKIETLIKTEDLAKKTLSICPFSSIADNENQLSKEFLNDELLLEENVIGQYLNNYIGHVKDESLRLKASSGGIITWLLLKLLKNNDITHVVHVGKENNKGILFNYVVSSDEEEVIAGASSKYYPVEMSSVLSFIKNTEGRFAVVALPCFAKGLRLLQKTDNIYRHRIKYIISPICGHLKATNYAKFLAWQKGISVEILEGINFRKKIPNAPASQYGTKFDIKKNDSIISITVPNKTFKMGTDWGHGMFKYPVCDYCDDIVGEVADISIGDAWLPEYIKDYKGTSVVTVRNQALNTILKTGIKENELDLRVVTPETIRKSQEGGIRHKRQDLQYRLFLKDQQNEWYPPKRVQPSSDSIDSKRKKIVLQRLKISKYSHTLFSEAMKENNLNFFFYKMTPFLVDYKKIQMTSFAYLKFLLKKYLKK